MQKAALLVVLICCATATVRAEEAEAAQKSWLSWGNGPVAQFFKGRRPSLLHRVFGEREEQAEKDWQLTLRCREALALDRELAPLNLDVSVEQGVATLEGPVSTSELRDRAGKAMHGVKGVRSVRNQLRITILPRTSSPPPRTFPALDQKTPVKLGQPIQTDPVPKPPEPPAKLTGQSRNDSSWIDPNWPRSEPARPLPETGDPRCAIAHVLRVNPGFTEVRYSVEGKVIWLKGRVETQARHEDLVRAIQSALSSQWQLRDQIVIGTK